MISKPNRSQSLAYGEAIHLLMQLGYFDTASRLSRDYERQFPKKPPRKTLAQKLRAACESAEIDVCQCSDSEMGRIASEFIKQIEHKEGAFHWAIDQVLDGKSVRSASRSRILRLTHPLELSVMCLAFGELRLSKLDMLATDWAIYQ